MKESLNPLQRLIVEAAEEKKAFDVLILDLRGYSDLTDFFILCSGSSKMQVQAIADSVLDRVYDSEFHLSSIEGYSSGMWVALDLIDVVVHIFHKEVRHHYDLERLWGDVPVIQAACQ